MFSCESLVRVVRYQDYNMKLFFCVGNIDLSVQLKDSGTDIFYANSVESVRIFFCGLKDTIRFLNVLNMSIIYLDL